MPEKQTTYTDHTSIFQKFSKIPLFVECFGTCFFVFYTNWTYGQLIEGRLNSTSYGITCGLTLTILTALAIRQSGGI